MAFPTIADRSQQTTASGTSHVLNLPATVDAGDLLLIIYRSTEPIDTITSGWTILFENNLLHCVYKVADGTEDSGTVTITTVNTAVVRGWVHRITGAGGIEAGTTASGSSSQPDPPSLSPSWGATDTLWILLAASATSLGSLTSYPTNYSNGEYVDSVALTANRQNNTATENPSAFVMGSSASWDANTIAITGPLNISMAVMTASGAVLALTGKIDANMSKQTADASMKDLADVTTVADMAKMVATALMNAITYAALPGPRIIRSVAHSASTIIRLGKRN